MSIWQYVYRYDSPDDAMEAYRANSPEIVHADDGAFKWSVSPGVVGIAADDQKLVSPDDAPPSESTEWYFWGRSGAYVVEVVIRRGNLLIPRTQVEGVVAQVDRAVRAAVDAEGTKEKGVDGAGVSGKG